MFDDLDAVPWASLQHHYGSADDLPPLLRALVEGDDAQAAHACGELDNALYHQGGWIPDSATAALPYLVEASLSRRCPHRASVLMLLATLTQGAAYAQPENVDAGWPAAWQRATAGLERLIGDPDRVVRVAAVAALTWGATGPATAGALTAQLATEADEGVRLELLLGVGATLKHHPDPAARRVLEKALSGAHPQQRLAAVLALAQTDPDRPVAEQDTVVDALVAPDIDVWSGTETVRSAVGAVREATDLYAANPPIRQAVVMALHERNTNPALRVVVLGEFATVMHYSRAAVQPLVPFVASYLDDETDLASLLLSLHLLAAAGPVAAGYADTIHDLGARHPEPGEPIRGSIRGVAAWALARMGDERTLAFVVDGLARSDDVFSYSSVYASGRWAVSMFAGPTAAEVLEQLPAANRDVAKAVERALRRRRGLPAAHGLRRAAEALAPTFPSVVPALLPLLRDKNTAVVTAEALLRFAPGDLPRWRWKLTSKALDPACQERLLLHRFGDPKAGLTVLPNALAEQGFRAQALLLAAELGEHLTEPLTARLRELTSESDPWVSTRAAYALWRAGGDVTMCGAVIEKSLTPLADGRWLPVMLPSLEKLIELRHASPPTRELLQQQLASDSRVSDAAGWRCYTEDERFRALAGQLLDLTAQ